MPKTWFIGGGWRLPKRSTHAALQTWKFAPTAVWIVAVAIGGNALSKEDRPMLRASGRRTLRSEAQYARTLNERLGQIPSVMASLRVYSESRRDRTLAIEIPSSVVNSTQQRLVTACEDDALGCPTRRRVLDPLNQRHPWHGRARSFRGRVTSI
jgi:hypothetical protein